ncbi:MarR family winged helix-turn-helix transcriptional regulator [Paenibacillus daejeonensis]|uniref:MarR family winged helix-turn-helix transcriptional regulator n=1 Tax=Paenibacillus daejeonensis TaxID=135193 RepID=UPI00037C1464|nr:MarR family winged helix-turn-helix transcriptional regulator [Paenibacillus daejeonensis]
MDSNSNVRREIILQTYRASLLLDKVGRELAAEQGLTSKQQWFILGMLYHEGEQALRDLTRNMLVSKQNMTGMVQRLRQGGYVATSEDKMDKRITLVSITDRGREAYEALVSSSRERNRDTFADFDAGELQELRRLMDKLVGHLMEKNGMSSSSREEEEEEHGH